MILSRFVDKVEDTPGDGHQIRMTDHISSTQKVLTGLNGRLQRTEMETRVVAGLTERRAPVRKEQATSVGGSDAK